jgi:hypothetical protein
MSSKKGFKSPADEFLTKPKTQETPRPSVAALIPDNSISNIKSNRKTIVVSDMFDNIRDDREAGATHSFYLTNRTFNALKNKAKAKNISNSKFLEGILSQLFFGVD